MLGLLRTPSGQNTLSTKQAKQAPEPVVTEVNPSEEALRKDTAATSSPPLQSPPAFQSSPLLSGSMRANKRSMPYAKRSLMRTTTGQSAGINFVKDQYYSVRQKCQRELGASVGFSALDTSHAGLLDWIREERVARLPRRGSAWDRVLISVHYFAVQVNRLSEAIESFTPECGAASNLLYGQCLLLLEIGHENAAALQTAFDLFYQLGLELSPLLRAQHALLSDHSIMEDISRAFSELLHIVSGIAIGFHSAVHGSRHSTTKLDIYATFGASIDNYRSRLQHCEYAIWNVELQRSHGHDGATQIDTLQEWLEPQDKVLSFLSSNHISLASRPEHYTCNWFQSPLNQFLKHDEKMLLVEGKSGFGKTTLANWVVNRLQRPVGGRVISTLSFFYNSSVTAQASCLHMLKTLLFQLLSLRIGDLDLFNVIFKAYTDSQSLATTKAQEERLWEALRQALYAVSGDDDNLLTIVIDGLDEIEGLKAAAKQVSMNLQKLVQDAAGLRVILFSQPLDIDSTHLIEKIELSLDNVDEDVRTIIRQGLSKLQHFSDRDYSQQDHIIDNLLTIADGSMLSATLFVEYLAQHKTHAEFNKAVESLLKSPPRSVAELVQRLLGVCKLDADSKIVLSCLVAAKRPLSFTELELLLRVGPKGAGVDKPLQIASITKSITAFTVTVEGLIALRHDAIKQALLSVPDTSNVSLHLKDRHKDLLIRLLSCSVKHLQDLDEPRLDLSTSPEFDRRLASNYLLEYTVRYWAIHFKLSSLFKVQGDLQLPDEFASVFPESVSFALLEASRWKVQCLPDEAVELFTIAFRVRKTLFGLENASVLQSAITCAVFYETVLTRYTEASQWYSQVVRIGKTILGFQSELIVTCCNTLLRISETLVTKKRTEIMTYREEILLVLISSYTHQYGATSKEVLQVYESLAELYVFISEETKASEIRVRIREIHSGYHDHHSVDHDPVSRELGVILRKHKHIEEVEGYDSLLFGYEGEVEESWSIVHVETMIRFAVELVNRGQFSGAEELYVELWLKLTEYCHTTQVCEWHEKRIEVMLSYASFLHSHNRTEEASAVLICCWNEYSNHQVSMFESIILLLKEIALCMKTVGLVSLSLTVFQRCWSWFKSTHKEESSVFKETVEQIAITSSEIVKKSSTTTTTTTTSTSETVIREVFESSFSSTETQITTTTLELCNSLTSIYIEQEKWSEAVSVIKSTLKRAWASFFSESLESVILETTFSSQSIKLVLDLAQCYINQKRYDKVEYIYVRLYRVHCKALKFDDVAVIRYRELYIEFLKKYEMHSALISFYQELLVEYRSFYGPAHNKTVEILYALGDACRSHHLTHGYWIEYYSEIIIVLNKGALICHEDALRALTIVAEYYYETQRYAESLVYLKSIIATFCQFGTKHKYFQATTFVQKTFERYYRVIEETQIEIHEHIKILKEIREACSKFYGESSEISLSVTVTLAEVCTKSEKYQFEAISYYEHIMKHSSTVSTTSVKRSQSVLRSLYVKQITSTSSSTTVTKETLEKATTMTMERYVEIKKTHSCTHESTLTTLKELVVLYQKQKRVELAIRELKNLVAECVLTVSSSKELIETARSIASIYVGAFASYGFELVRELKLQVIYKSVSKAVGFDVVKAGRSCFAFIAAFEYYLRAGEAGTIAGYMAEILAEFIFYERLVSSIKVKAKVGVVILHGARLRDILVRTKRSEDFDNIVERQILDYFTIAEVNVVKGSTKSAVRSFVRILLVHFSQHRQPKNFVASAARAAVSELKIHLENKKYRLAYELAQCTYRFLMAHEGLDDPTEITLGFQLCLMMAGRGEYRRTVIDEETNKDMLLLSRDILGEVFDICKNNKIDLCRCPLTELNELVSLIGDQKDRPRLLWLLNSLWISRDKQTSWDPEVKLTLGTRLVQARFVAGDIQVATRLAEDIVYNLRRINGPRHRQTLAMYELLASIYTSAGHHFTNKSTAESASEGDKKRDGALAKSYFKKAVTVNEDLLKLLVETDADDSEDDDDDFSVVSSHHGSVRSRRSAYGLGRRSVSNLTVLAARPHGGNKIGSGHEESDVSATVASHRHHEAPREVLVEVARKHLWLAKLAVQRYGGWDRLMTRRFDMLTTKIRNEFGAELKLKEEQILSNKWKVQGFGNGKAEGGYDEDGFVVPGNWAIC